MNAYMISANWASFIDFKPLFAAFSMKDMFARKPIDYLWLFEFIKANCASLTGRTYFHFKKGIDVVLF